MPWQGVTGETLPVNWQRETSVKGPFERLKYDLRRLWECPECHHRVRTPGTRTTRMCRCTLDERGRPTPMKLIADGPRRRTE